MVSHMTCVTVRTSSEIPTQLARIAALNRLRRHPKPRTGEFRGLCPIEVHYMPDDAFRVVCLIDEDTFLYLKSVPKAFDGMDLMPFPCESLSIPLEVTSIPSSRGAYVLQDVRPCGFSLKMQLVSSMMHSAFRCMDRCKNRYLPEPFAEWKAAFAATGDIFEGEGKQCQMLKHAIKTRLEELTANEFPFLMRTGTGRGGRGGGGRGGRGIGASTTTTTALSVAAHPSTFRDSSDEDELAPTVPSTRFVHRNEV